MHGLPAIAAPGIEGAGKAAEEGLHLGASGGLCRGPRDQQVGGVECWCLRLSWPPIALVESEEIKVSRELHVNKMYIPLLAGMSSQLSQRWSSGPRHCNGSTAACGVGSCGEWMEMRPERSARLLNAMLRREHSPKGRASHERVFKQGRDIVRCRGCSAMGTGKWGSLTSGFMEKGVMGMVCSWGGGIGWVGCGVGCGVQGVWSRVLRCTRTCGKGGKRAGVEAVLCWRGKAEHRAKAGARAGQGPDHGLGSASSSL